MEMMQQDPPNEEATTAIDPPRLRVPKRDEKKPKQRQRKVSATTLTGEDEKGATPWGLQKIMDLERFGAVGSQTF